MGGRRFELVDMMDTIFLLYCDHLNLSMDWDDTHLGHSALRLWI